MMRKVLGFFSFQLIIMTALFLPRFAFGQATETLTIATYYPAPFGVYRELQMLKSDRNQEIRLNSDNSGNPNIELRYLSNILPAGEGTPYIDFSNDPSINFDYRVILAGNDDLRFVGGTATFATDSGTYGNVRAAEFWICSGAVTAP